MSLLTLQRSWTHGSVAWWAWAIVFSLLAATLGAAAWAWQQASLQAGELHARFADASNAVRPAAPAAVPQEPEFARSLGLPLPASQVVHELQRACGEAGVQLVSVQAQERLPSAEQLGRLDVTVHLRGSYSSSKQVLKQVAERFAALTVQRLRLRRASTSSEVETQATLSLWSAPLLPSLEGR